MKSNINLQNNKITFLLDTNVYPQEIVYRTCYVYIDRMHIYLDRPKKNEILISLKGKEKLTKAQLENLKGDFVNELLNTLLRENIAKKNKKLLEYLVGGTITASLERPQIKRDREEELEAGRVQNEIAQFKKELEKMEIPGDKEYGRDLLGIRQIFKTGKKSAQNKWKKK